MGFKDWETPPDFFKALDEEFHFTLDAAASHENALCKFYCTREGMFSKDISGDTYSTQSYGGDGLTLPWKGHRVFCNPPYDSSIYRWVEKAANREAEVAVLLLPPSVDTRWFHKFIWPDKANEIQFLQGRLKFWKDGKIGPAPRAGNLLAIFRQ